VLEAVPVLGVHAPEVPGLQLLDLLDRVELVVGRHHTLQGCGQSSARNCASMPPSQKITEPQKNRAFGPSRYSSNAAISSGRPLRPSGDANASISGPTVGWSRPSWSSGVWMAPGATALSVMPAPAHSGVGALRRTHQASAVLVTG